MLWWLFLTNLESLEEPQDRIEEFLHGDEQNNNFGPLNYSFTIMIKFWRKMDTFILHLSTRPGQKCWQWCKCFSDSSLVPLQIFEVMTSTRIKDLTLNIARKLGLTTADGFSIFVKTHDKVGFTFLNLEHWIFDIFLYKFSAIFRALRLRWFLKTESVIAFLLGPQFERNRLLLWQSETNHRLVQESQQDQRR